MAIKLIALDLDGTTLDRDMHMSEANRTTLEAAIEKGVNVVIATGRSHSALPEDVFKVKGIRYMLTSNGAAITDLQQGGRIYENCLAPSAVETTVDILKKHDFMVEAFINGDAFIDRKFYDGMRSSEYGYRHIEYVLKTRKPVDDLFSFILENREHIENLNVVFQHQEDRSMMREVLGAIPDSTLTTAFDNNLELGGATTSKAAALLELGKILDVRPDEMMAMGDSPNDMAMMEIAGLPVAVGNAKPEVKAIAKYISATNEENGVAEAVRKFVL